MKKSHTHTDLSDHRCMKHGCRKLIKSRLIESKLHVPLCYAHYCEYEAAHRGHTVNTKPRMKRLAAGLPVKTY